MFRKQQQPDEVAQEQRLGLCSDPDTEFRLGNGKRRSKERSGMAQDAI